MPQQDANVTTQTVKSSWLEITAVQSPFFKNEISVSLNVTLTRKPISVIKSWKSSIHAENKWHWWYNYTHLKTYEKQIDTHESTLMPFRENVMCITSYSVENPRPPSRLINFSSVVLRYVKPCERKGWNLANFQWLRLYYSVYYYIYYWILIYFIVQTLSW